MTIFFIFEHYWLAIITTVLH